MIGPYGVGSTLARSELPCSLLGCAKGTGLFTGSQKPKSSEAAHRRYMGFGKCVNVPHFLQLCTGAHYINVMSANQLLCVVLYVSKLYGPLVDGSFLVFSGLLSYKSIIGCGRDCLILQTLK